jgi:hypothetical protein
MTPLKFRFKAKPKNRTIRVPDFTPSHVAGPEGYNQLTLNIALRKAYAADPSKRPAKILNLDALPHNAKVLHEGFMVEVELSV